MRLRALDFGCFFPQENKTKAQEEFVFLIVLMMDENVAECLGLASRSLFQKAIHPEFVRADTGCLLLLLSMRRFIWVSDGLLCSWVFSPAGREGIDSS